jgi:replicative DNA helicase
VEIVNTSRAVEGLRWRLESLNKRLGSLRQGNFGFIFARPETGKTTLLASEVTFMAAQATNPVLWFNNEQVGTEVMLRCYQSALGMDNTQLLSNLEENREKYLQATKDNIKLKDSASIHFKQVEAICKKIQPSLIVFDQIDKLKGFDNDREDLRLGSIYIWARELAKTYCPVIGVCQADGSGEGVRWLSMANVANAKTSKQAEADWILGVGKVNEAGYDNLRFLHLSKNKLWGDEDTDPKLRHDRWETLIEPEIGRYRDL